MGVTGDKGDTKELLADGENDEKKLGG